MNYSVIKRCDIADGPGVRVSLFVSGCRNHCEGCFQPQTWDFNYGQPFDNDAMNLIMTELKKSFIQGLTVLGGDPLEPENSLIFDICDYVKAETHKDIWMYTGYVFEDLPGDVKIKIMNNVDVLVDGPFVSEKRDLSLRFRGSSNQRIIDIHKTDKAGKVVLWTDPSKEDKRGVMK